MMRLASSLEVGDTVGVRNAVVVAIEPLNDDMLRMTFFVDGEVQQQDAHSADSFGNVRSPPALIEALQALSDLSVQVERMATGVPGDAERRAADVLATARRLGIMVRYGGVYTVRKS